MSMQDTPMLKDTFNTESGLVGLQYPSKMSLETYEDIKSWLQLQIRKIARTVEEKK